MSGDSLTLDLLYAAMERVRGLAPPRVLVSPHVESNDSAIKFDWPKMALYDVVPGLSPQWDYLCSPWMMVKFARAMRPQFRAVRVWKRFETALYRFQYVGEDPMGVLYARA